MSCSRYTRCLGTRARKLCTSGKTAAHWQAGRQTNTHQGLMASPCVSPAGQPAATAGCRPLLVRPFCRASTPQSLPSAEESGKDRVCEQEGFPRTHQTLPVAFTRKQQQQGRGHPKSCSYPHRHGYFRDHAALTEAGGLLGFTP